MNIYLINSLIISTIYCLGRTNTRPEKETCEIQTWDAKLLTVGYVGTSVNRKLQDVIHSYTHTKPSYKNLLRGGKKHVTCEQRFAYDISGYIGFK